MKVLVISHNVFCKTSNMGKTLMAYFKGWNTEDIAQLYVHSEVPTDDICKNYYRMTDKEIIKSIVTRKSGCIFTESDIKEDLADSRTDTGTTAQLYQKARARTPLIYFARNLWWKLGAWKTKKLLRWVDDFNPDVIFLASGDYSFIYDIALTLAKRKSIPLAVSCMDDYYFHNKNEKRFGGKLVHKSFMKKVRKTMAYSSCIFPICEKMSKDYGKLFGKPCYTLGTPSSISDKLSYEKNCAISYIGNLGYNRHLQLVAMGQALKTIDCPDKPAFIDVYSAESRPEILSLLTEENGVRFNGSVSSDEVLRIMGQSMGVIHTESFDENIKESVKYSVSTKIADSLISGTPILAYGPSEIASIEYLKDNDAAYCINDSESLRDGLRDFIENAKKRNAISENAFRLAKENHDSEKNCKMIREVFELISKQISK